MNPILLAGLIISFTAGCAHRETVVDDPAAQFLSALSSHCGKAYAGRIAVNEPASPDDAFLDALHIFGLGFSWGGFESLAIWCDPQFKVRGFQRDYGGPVIRLHIGLEAPDDLIADLRGGLDAYADRAV